MKKPPEAEKEDWARGGRSEGRWWELSQEEELSQADRLEQLQFGAASIGTV